MMHLRFFSETLGKSLCSETVFLRGLIHSDIVSLSHIHHEWPECTAYCYWISLLLLHSLFSILFLVKNTYGVKEGRTCGGKGLFAFSHAFAYRMKNPPGLKEGKSYGILWLSGHSGTNRCW